MFPSKTTKKSYILITKPIKYYISDTDILLKDLLTINLNGTATCRMKSRYKERKKINVKIFPLWDNSISNF